MAFKSSALKIVEPSHMPELKKTKDVHLKTKESLLKFKSYSQKLKMVQVWTENANTHPNKHTHSPVHRHLTWMITIRSAYGWA